MSQEMIQFVGYLIMNGLFPIVACGAMFWKMNKDTKLHKDETDKLSEVIKNNTIVLEKILTKLGIERDNI